MKFIIVYQCMLRFYMCFNRILGTSYEQVPFFFSSLIFNLLNMTLLAYSTWPFVWGCSTEANICFIPSSKHSLPNCWLANWVPLSNIRCLKIPKRHKCSSTQSASPCEQLSVSLAQLQSTWWSTRWPQWDTLSDILPKGKDLKCLFPMYGKATGYKLTATPRLAFGANQRASDIAHNVVHISRNPPSWLTNNTQLGWPSTRELVLLYDCRKCPHGARPLCGCIDLHLHMWGLGGYNRDGKDFHLSEYTVLYDGKFNTIKIISQQEQ